METTLNTLMDVLHTSGFKALTATLAKIDNKDKLNALRDAAIVAGRAKGGNFNQFYDVASEIVIHIMNLNRA